MNVLLDTHCWLWWFISPEKLSDRAKSIIQNNQNTILFSAVSSWEIAIKVGLQRLKLPEPPFQYVTKRLENQNMTSFAIQHIHALRVAELPHHHRDPFDRLLIAQAQVEKLPILTSDPQFQKYDIEVIL